MPYALLLIGAVLLVAAVRNTYKDLWALVESDFSGTGGFLSWVAAIAVIGGLGYIPKLKPLSIALMTLLLIVLVISNGGVFAKLQAAIQGAGAGIGSAGLSGATAGTGGGIQPLTPLQQIQGNLTSGVPNG